jgi:hypothetical protein
VPDVLQCRLVNLLVPLRAAGLPEPWPHVEHPPLAKAHDRRDVQHDVRTVRGVFPAEHIDRRGAVDAEAGERFLRRCATRD